MSGRLEAPDSAYHSAVDGIVCVMHDAAAAGHGPLLDAGVSDLLVLTDRAQTHEQEAIATHGMAQALAALATYRRFRGEPERAQRLARLGWEMLEARNQKRAAAGLSPRPATLARTALLSVVAALHGSDGQSVAFLSPHQILSNWLALGARVREKADQLTCGTPEHRALIESQLYCGLQVCICIWRHDRQAASVVVEEWNGWLDSLTDIPRLGKTLDGWQPNTPPHPWWWEFELSKAVISAREPGHRLLRADFDKLAGGLRVALAAASEPQFCQRFWHKRMVAWRGSLPYEPSLATRPAS